MITQFKKSLVPDKPILSIVAVGVFLITIPLANWTLDRYGFIDVPWLGLIPAGTAWIGLAFVSRDMAQLLAGKRIVIGAIIVGALLSAWLANPGLAWASFAALLLSESLDMAIYTPLADRGMFAPGVFLSSVIGGMLDSALFLWLAFDSTHGWWQLAVAKGVIVAVVTPLAIGGRHAIIKHEMALT